MAIYAIGDLHGCYREFRKLLDKIEFDHSEDQLYLVGDLINRGPISAKTLSYLMQHTEAMFPVLSNHDLAFLVFQAGLIRLKRHDTYGELMEHEQLQEYVRFIRQQPLMRYIPELDIAICHAGIYPKWTIDQALGLAKEAEMHLQNDALFTQFLPQMFGNDPNIWSEDLTGIDRVRSIINIFTRMRYLHADLSLDFNAKEPMDEVVNLYPWFRFPNNFNQTQVVFGHWASLGLHNENNIMCIDSGCAWGEKLTAVRLDVSPQLIVQKKRKADKD